MSRCEFSDLPVESCAHCTGRTGEPLPEDRPTITATFRARFPGRCDWCPDGQIEPGQLMGRDDEGDYVCARCLP